MDLPPGPAPRSAAAVLGTALGTLALIAAGLGALYALNAHRAPTFPEAAERAAVLRAAAPWAEAAVFGNSHAYGLDFARLGRRGVYLNEPGGDLFEARHLLRNAVRRLPRLREVYLVVPPLQGDNALMGWNMRRRLVYATTGDFRPISGDWRLAASTAAALVTRHDHGYRLLRPAPSVPGLRPDGFPRQAGWQAPPDSVAVRGVRQRARHQKFEAAVMAATPDFCSRLAEAFRAFIQEAGDRQVVLFTPPYFETYLQPPPACDARPLARAAAEAAPNAVYFDYSEGPMSRQPELFLDGTHLDTLGAARFTEALARDLAPSAALVLSSMTNHATGTTVDRNAGSYVP